MGCMLLINPTNPLTGREKIFSVYVWKGTSSIDIIWDTAWKVQLAHVYSHIFPSNHLSGTVSTSGQTCFGHPCILWWPHDFDDIARRKRRIRRKSAVQDWSNGEKESCSIFTLIPGAKSESGPRKNTPAHNRNSAYDLPVIGLDTWRWAVPVKPCIDVIRELHTRLVSRDEFCILGAKMFS